jgi:hypothetical protein
MCPQMQGGSDEDVDEQRETEVTFRPGEPRVLHEAKDWLFASWGLCGVLCLVQVQGGPALVLENIFKLWF